jgi:hypothetical protein
MKGYEKEFYQKDFLVGKTISNTKIVVDHYGREWVVISFSDGTSIRVVPGIPSNPMYFIFCLDGDTTCPITRFSVNN